MFKLFLKYGALLYLINTILLSIEATFDIGYKIFIVILSFYSFLIVINPAFIKKVILNKSFHIFIIINIINLIYFLVFHNLTDIGALKYIAARFMQFSILAGSIYYNFNYYKTLFLTHICYILFTIVLLGIIINPELFTGRYTGITWNANMLASFCTLGFGISILNYQQKNIINFGILIIFFLIALLTGSRGVLVGIPLAFIFKYGFSYTNILYGTFGFIIYISVPLLNLNTSIDRFVNKEILNTRLINYKVGFNTILENPFSGFGLDKYSGETFVPEYLLGTGKSFTAHNAYLAILIQYGIIFGFVFLLIIFRMCFLLFYYFKDDSSVLSHLYIIFYTLLAGIYETLISGINDFHTILFWFSIAYLGYYKYQKKYES